MIIETQCLLQHKQQFSSTNIHIVICRTYFIILLQQFVC